MKKLAILLVDAIVEDESRMKRCEILHFLALFLQRYKLQVQ